MTTADSVSAVFIDTNVLVYATITAAPFYQQARSAIRDREDEGAELWLSRQVLREYLATLSRPQSFTQPLPASVLTAQARLHESQFQIAEDSSAVTARLLSLVDRFPVAGKQVHDANIVATMQVYGIRRLLTHNVADFTRFASLLELLPLIPAP